MNIMKCNSDLGQKNITLSTKRRKLLLLPRESFSCPRARLRVKVMQISFVTQHNVMLWHKHSQWRKRISEKKRSQKFSFGKSYCAHPQFIPDHLYLWNFILCLLRDNLKTRVTHLWSRVHQLCVCLIKNSSFTPCWLIFRSVRLSSEMALASLSYLVNGGKEALTQFLTKHNSLEGTLISIESAIGFPLQVQLVLLYCSKNHWIRSENCPFKLLLISQTIRLLW